MLQLDDPVTALRGVGPTMADALEALGITTVDDLVRHWPRRHLDLGQLQTVEGVPVGEKATMVGTITGWSTRRIPRGTRRPKELRIAEATVVDRTGAEFRVSFFNQPHQPRVLPEGTTAAFSGRTKRYRGAITVSSPTVVPLDEESIDVAGNRLQPRYPASSRVSTERIAALVEQALDALPPLVEWQDEVVLAEHGLVGHDEAVRQMHHPDDLRARDRARDRLAFDELFVLQLGLQWRRAQVEARVQGIDNTPGGPAGHAAGFLASLPFDPTGAQHRAMHQVGGDLAAGVPMHRLLQGDVGSGKTLVAVWTLLCAVDHGRQGALMAPTEVLAEQHFATLLAQLEPLGVNMLDGLRVELLTGSTPVGEQRRILSGLMTGEVDVLVGTHALLEERVAFVDLGVVVIDEQHRFGVDQRTALRDKRAGLGDGDQVPDVLVMTATPIPRSMALTVYGDLDVTVIDELPPGRTPIVTQLITPSEPHRRPALEQFVRDACARGERAYWVCPFVTESDALPGKAAESWHQQLATRVFPDLEVELVHGQMGSREKERRMQRFRDGEAQVLVATTVIEVGVDVPEASVMVIEDAERFGLSQLHQLRGRVGRGAARSYCVLFAGWEEALGEGAEERLLAVASTTDGFELAERDLQVRGAGKVLGSEQSGLPDLRLASITDARLVAATRTAAQLVVGRDPDLSQHPSLRQEVVRRHDGLETFERLGTG